MPVHLTVTFNPAIDKSCSVNSLIPEKKLRCSPPVYEPGGGGINVARAMLKLGFPATALYLAGGCSGDRLSELLQQEGVPVIAVPTRQETRENFHLVDTSANLQYRFVMPGAAVAPEEWQDCLDRAAAIPDLDYLVVSGSLPEGIPEDIFHRLSKIATEKSARLIIDCSQPALLHTRNSGAFLIKPNLSELCILANRPRIHLEEIQSIARDVILNGFSQVLVVSVGESGAMLITADQFYRAIPPVVSRKSTVGAGDSMLAGIITSLIQNRSLEETIRYGVACGTAACLNPGTALCQPTDVEKIYQMTRVFTT